MTISGEKYLLTDFGASRIKSALFDFKSGKISDVKSYNSVEPCILQDKKFEVSLDAIKQQFLKIVESYCETSTLKGIFVCSEMHGFALLNEKNEPLSNYISWKDERCTDTIDGISSFELLKEKLNGRFFEKTGMKPRVCYPIFNLFHMIRKNEITNAKVISLPEWLCCCSNDSLNIAHCTMSAGLGFFNIHKNQFDEELINEACLNREKISFNKASQSVEIGGFVHIKENKIPIYTGVGDHQCAVLGAGNAENTISVNLGTGSQVAMISLDNDKSEKRPYFEGKKLSTITHIPSGRALNCFIGFLESINPQRNFWQELGMITIEDIKNSTMEINMGIFESAWNYNNGGFLTNIKENEFSLNNYLASLLKSYIMQYKKAIEELNPDPKYNKIILGGGVANKLNVIKNYLSEITGYEVILSNNEFDETFTGLTKLVKIDNGCKLC